MNNCNSHQQIPCCTKHDLINYEGIHVRRGCGTVDSYDAANAYIDFYENKHKYVRKSIYQRKYRLKNK